MRFAKSRDANEGIVVAALEAAGCVVWKVSDTGFADLVVQRPDGQLMMIEVKNLSSSTHGKKSTARGVADPMAYLTPAQVKGWARWVAAGGKPPVIVTCVDEALAAVRGPVAAFETKHAETAADANRASEAKPERSKGCSKMEQYSGGGK